MESDKLYRVQKEDLPKVEKMLNQCFAHDPLYETLITDPEVRKNLMPELFKCDIDRKSTRLNSSHSRKSRMPSSA